jgi:hypothetical protein
MVARAVSARDWLAPLAVLVPILAMLIGAAWAFTVFPPLALLLSIMPLALLAGVFAALLVLAVAPGTPGFCET